MASAVTTAPTVAYAGAGEQSRARYPDASGHVERDGQRLYFELYGDGEETLFLLPPWSIVHSRHWKMQIPYLARHFRVLVMDGLGNGGSDRCRDPRRYSSAAGALDALAVMDATGTEQALGIGLSQGAQYLLELARLAPERLIGAAFIDSVFPYTPSQWWVLLNPRFGRLFVRPSPVYRWWGRMNAVHWRESYPEFVEWFISRCLSEPHSTKAIEDGVSWGLDTDPDTLIATAVGETHYQRSVLRELARGVECPVLVVHGDRDRITPFRDGRALARLTGAPLEAVRGGGHLPHARKPVQVNVALRDFSEGVFGRTRTPLDPTILGRTGTARDPTVHRGDGRPRALYISSPIGLGHVRRDVAIANELRRLHPDLEIDWLAQDPVTRVLETEGEHIHPASRHLASESGHFESESAEHDLHCFQALRRMDEILAANFMVFHDVVREQRYDLWIGDEAWELDYYLHENPREKRVPFAWMTDFVGFLPMDGRDARESFLCSDYNAQMVEHVAGHPSVRDRAIFVGDADDIVPDRLGADLPLIRDWTEANFEFAGYVTGFDPAALGDRGELRARAWLRARRARVRRGCRRLGSRLGSAAPRDRRLPACQAACPGAPDDHCRGAADRPGIAWSCGRRRTRDTAVCARPLPPPRGVRPSRGAGRPDDRDGADRQPAPVHLLPAQAPLRAELPRASSPPAPRRGAANGLRLRATGCDRRGDRRGDRPRG